MSRLPWDDIAACHDMSVSMVTLPQKASSRPYNFNSMECNMEYNIHCAIKSVVVTILLWNLMCWWQILQYNSQIINTDEFNLWEIVKFSATTCVFDESVYPVDIYLLEAFTYNKYTSKWFLYFKKIFVYYFIFGTVWNCQGCPEKLLIWQTLSHIHPMHD